VPKRFQSEEALDELFRIAYSFKVHHHPSAMKSRPSLTVTCM